MKRLKGNATYYDKMPLKPIDYSKGVQYKIVCNDPTITDCYNGSTCSLKDRKGEHKKSCIYLDSKQYNYKVYQFIRENGGWDNWVFIQLEESPCKSKQELLARERHWFDLLMPTLISKSPMTTPEERKKQKNEYNATHTEERKKYDANRKEVTCECGCVSIDSHLPRHQRTQKHLNLMAQKQ